MHEGRAYILRCGPLHFSIHQASERYNVTHYEPTELHRRASKDPTAWTAMDLPALRTTKLKEDGSVGSFYQILLIYAFLLWSENCLAVYFPAEQVSVPSLGGLAESIK